MKARRSAFNLIEITLAIAVVGIGVAAVMALFVPALNASKDSLTDTYTADVVNTFVTYVRGALTRDWSLDRFTTRSAKDIEGEMKNPKEHPLTNDPPNNWNLDKLLIPNTGIYSSEDKSIFRIKVDPDFTAHMRIWYEVLNNTTNNPNQFNKNGTAVSPAITDGLVRFYFELSWPATIPYAARKKSLYVTEFYNRNLEAKRCY